MTDDAPGGEEDLAAGIFGDVEYTPGQAVSKEFQPWHRPRKQFVRREQWSALLRRLFDGRPTTEPLRYLGLPGVDLLDLRYLYEEVCRADERPMRFLGFNTQAQPGSAAHIELSLSLDEVRRLPNVDPVSNVIHDDFRRIAAEASIAWNRTLSLGPFDVVNIDLCDGLATDPPGMEASIYAALARLVALQVRSDKPWLLLVTTRIGRGMFDPDAEQRLLDIFRANVGSCEGFVEACANLLESDPASIDAAGCTAGDFLCLMVVALAKWVSALAQAHGPNRVELASAHGYRVEPGAACEDLVSLALRFEPVITAPTNPLSPSPPDPVDECALAKAIARRAAARLDVDGILEDRPGLSDELAAETERLLIQARYDVTHFPAWLAT